MSNLDIFKKRFLDEVVNVENGVMSKELSSLFDQVLEGDFNGDPERMEGLIMELHNSKGPLSKKIPTVNERLDLIEQAVLELATKELGGLD